MKKLLILFLVASLTGCGGVEIDDNHGYGYGYDFIDVDGTRLRNSPSLSFTQDEFVSFISDQYKQVEVCAEVLTGGPLVVLVDPSVINFTAGKTYFGDDPLILLSTTYAHDLTVIRHEYVHYLLDRLGMPDNQNSAHDSPLFMKCSGRVT